MKHGKKLTARQRQLLRDRGLNPGDYLTVKALPDGLTVVHRFKGTLKVVRKGDA